MFSQHAAHVNVHVTGRWRGFFALDRGGLRKWGESKVRYVPSLRHYRSIVELVGHLSYFGDGGSLPWVASCEVLSRECCRRRVRGHESSLHALFFGPQDISRGPLFPCALTNIVSAFGISTWGAKNLDYRACTVGLVRVLQRCPQPPSYRCISPVAFDSFSESGEVRCPFNL